MNRFTAINDERLDAIVSEIKSSSPDCGSKLLSGYLRARNIHVQRRRVKESLTRVDPLGIQARLQQMGGREQTSRVLERFPVGC